MRTCFMYKHQQKQFNVHTNLFIYISLHIYAIHNDMFKVRQFSEFFVVLHVLRGEHTHSHVMQRVKTPAIPNNWLTSDDVM